MTIIRDIALGLASAVVVLGSIWGVTAAQAASAPRGFETPAVIAAGSSAHVTISCLDDGTAEITAEISAGDLRAFRGSFQTWAKQITRPAFDEITVPVGETRTFTQRVFSKDYEYYVDVYDSRGGRFIERAGSDRCS